VRSESCVRWHGASSPAPPTGRGRGRTASPPDQWEGRGRAWEGVEPRRALPPLRGAACGAGVSCSSALRWQEALQVREGLRLGCSEQSKRGVTFPDTGFEGGGLEMGAWPDRNCLVASAQKWRVTRLGRPWPAPGLGSPSPHLCSPGRDVRASCSEKKQHLGLEIADEL